MAYIDTSVLVAYYCPESLTDAAGQALCRMGEPAISQLVELELYSAVGVKLRARELDDPTVSRILSLFQQHLAAGRYTSVVIGAMEYSMARDWIGHFSVPLRAPDALHMAAAFRNDLVLLTADADLARAAKHFGVKCRLIS